MDYMMGTPCYTAQDWPAPNTYCIEAGNLNVKAKHVEGLLVHIADLGKSFFHQTISTDKLLNIRSSLCLYLSYDPDYALEDPLWHSCQLLEHFSPNCVKVAVPTGVSSLDENKIRCKGQTLAMTYMSSKPVNLAYASMRSSDGLTATFTRYLTKAQATKLV